MEKSNEEGARKLKEHKSTEQRLQSMLEKVKDKNYDLRENLNTLSEVKSINGKIVDDKMAKFLPKKDQKIYAL